MELNPFCQTEIQFVNKSEMIDQLLNIKNQCIMIIISELGAKRWGLEDLINKLKENNEIIWISQKLNNPTQQDILETLEKIKNMKVGIILAIGGGSTIDLAKAVSALWEESYKAFSKESITNAIINKEYQKKQHFIDIIAVPTTAGTGSEVTQWATVWDINGGGKYSIDFVKIKPKKAYIVAELTISLPRELTLATGLDALTHAVEAYWSRYTNPLSQEFSIRAIQLILKNMKDVLKNPYDLKIRDALCRASILAGLSFSFTRTTACHAISYPLTLFFHVPHGYAVAMTLDEMLTRNKGFIENETELLNLFQDFGGLKAWLRDICEGITSLRLSHYGIKETDIDMLAEMALKNGRMANNPVDIKREDIKDILLNIL